MAALSLAMVPGYAFMNGENWGYAVVKGLKELGTEDMLDPRLPEVAQKHFDEKDMKKITDEVAAHFYEATTNAVTIASCEGRPISHGALHSLLKSLIVQSWTAFENLVEDLWERAVNEHPHTLSQITPPERDKAPLIDLRVLQANNFDVSAVMGTLLKSRFKFHTLNEIKMAYNTAFSSNSRKVGEAIKDEYIACLYHLRNLIAHNTGIIDDHFLTEIGSVKAMDEIRALGKVPIPFDGPMVQKFVGNGVRCGCTLIQSVDDWLNANK